jgi:hypothetical protein
VDKKRIIIKMEGRGGEAQGVAEPPSPPPKKNVFKSFLIVSADRDVFVRLGRLAKEYSEATERITVIRDQCYKT